MTSKLEGTAIRGLEACELEPGWFETIVTADDPVPHKPDPAPVRLALEQMGIERAGDAMLVGDSVWDMRAGRAAGAVTAAALWGATDRAGLQDEEPDYALETIAELRALLSS